jgi:hypothetical protein
MKSELLITLEVAGDLTDFISVFNRLDKNNALYKKVQETIRDLKNDRSVGIRIKLSHVPKYYIRKHDVNAIFKVDLPGAWRLIYGILVIHGEKKTLLMELFDHNSYNKRFGYK